MTNESVFCRACRGGLRPVMSLGPTPVADRLLGEDHVCEPDLIAPIDVAYCPDCTLVQLRASVPPALLYGGDYPYYTTAVRSLVEHYQASARDLIQRRALGPAATVIEIASNDGHMLRVFGERGISVLGIDPAAGPAETARAIGVPTLAEFFTKELAIGLAASGSHADLILGNGVLNLVPDLTDFTAGIEWLLRKDGLGVFEVPYSVGALDRAEFDIFYHQNVCYFSATALDQLFRRHGLYLNHLEHVCTFGGSLRVFLEHEENVQDSVVNLLAEEKSKGIAEAGYYGRFAWSAEAIRDELRSMLTRLRRDGHSIAIYGAGGGPATTLLNYLALPDGTLDFAIDGNPHKRDRYTPGTRLKIHSPKALLSEAPDYVLLLAWRYRDEILSAQREYRERGGRFIVPFPTPEIV